MEPQRGKQKSGHCQVFSVHLRRVGGNLSPLAHINFLQQKHCGKMKLKDGAVSSVMWMSILLQ